MFYKKAYQCYNSIGNLFIPYKGNLTDKKREKIHEIAHSKGYNLGWVVSDLTIDEPDAYELRGYKYDGGGGRATVEIVELS